jgi:DNA-binding protein H-NS
MSFDLEKLTPQELAALIARANKRRKLLAKRKPAAQVKAAIARVLKQHGWTFEELFGKQEAAPKVSKPGKVAKKAGKRTSTGKVPPKYRNPANPNETWTGRGRPPRWLAAELAAGKALESFLIQDHAETTPAA